MRYTHKLSGFGKRCTVFMLVLVAAFMTVQPLAHAQISGAQRRVFDLQTRYYNVKDVGLCGTGDSTTQLGGGSGNADYAGRQILTQEQLKAIKANSDVYQEAAKKVGIPWQMLAVVHLREHSLKVSGPSNGDGPYQILSKSYPVGPYSRAQFLAASIDAAQFLKNLNKKLTANSTDAAQVKDTFFSYNGRSSKYAQQAISLFGAGTPPYEGSPYVMNIADAKRDPKVNTTTWGQVKQDHGPIEYPANGDYGAFVVFAAIAGVSIGGEDGKCPGSGGSVQCNGEKPASASGLSQVRQNVVCIAQQELALWNSGKLKPGTGAYHKYSQGRDENWCADFASWVFNEAKYPISTGNWNVPAVSTIWDIGLKGDRFHFHGAGGGGGHPSGYKPRPGDMIIHKNGQSHVNIVVGVSGNKVTIIGGNQGSNSFTTSKVTQYSNGQFYGIDGITGYVSPD